MVPSFPSCVIVKKSTFEYEVRTKSVWTPTKEKEINIGGLPVTKSPRQGDGADEDIYR